MNKKNMAMLIAIAMIFSLFTGINFGTGKAQAENVDVSDVKAATDCAINVSGEINGGEDTKVLTYDKYEGTAGPKTEAVSKAAFTISATESAIASYYYIEEVKGSDNYTVKKLSELKELDSEDSNKNAQWTKYENEKSLSDAYAGKNIVIYAKFVFKNIGESDNIAYLHTNIIEIAKETDVTPTETPTTEPSQSPTGEPTAEPSQSPTGEPTAEPSQSPTGEPTTEPSQSPTTEPSQSPTGELTAEPSQSPTTEPSQSPTETPTTEPSQSPTATPTATPTVMPTAEPSQNPTENPTTEPSQNPMVTPTVEPSKTPDKKLSVNYDNSDKYVKSGTALNLKVTVKTDTQCTYKWYKKGSDKSLSEKSSYKTPKKAKIGKYTYYCEISADGYETVKCEFTVIVYKSVITVAWGSSVTSKGIFGTSPNVKKITVPSKYKKNLSVNAKNGKISVKKYFSGKAVVTYIIGKNKIKITVKSKIPQIKYTATYSKKGKSLKIKIDSFAMKNLGNVYFMINGKKWTPVSYRLKDYGKKKGSYIIVGNLNSVVKKIECKFILGTTKYTAKAWKCSANAKKNKVKLVS